MKLSLSRQVLEDLVIPIASVIPKNPFLPSQSCISLKISGERLSCTATDGLVIMSKDMQVKHSEDVDLMIEGKTFVSAIKNLRSESMSMDIKDTYIQVSDTKSKYKIPLMNDVQMPNVSRIGDDVKSIDLSLSEFLRLRAASSFADPSNIKTIFNGICLDRGPHGLFAFACDGPSAYRFKMPYGTEGDHGQTFIPVNLFESVFKLIENDDEDRFYLHFTENRSMMYYKGFHVSCTNLDVGSQNPRFADYFNPGDPILVNPESIREMIPRVSKFCDDAGLVTLTISNKEVCMESVNVENESSQAVVSESIDCEGELGITISAKGLNKILASATSNFVDVSIGTKVKALYVVDRKSEVSSVQMGTSSI